jgi:hypothetical protein
MKNIWVKVLIGIIVIGVVLLVGRNLIIREVVVSGIRQATGLKIDVGQINVGILKPTVHVSGLKVYNPDSFSSRLMFDIPRIDVVYDLKAFMSGNVHLPLLDVDIAEVAVAQDKKLSLNMNALAVLVPKPSGKKSEVAIDRLSLKIGKLSYRNDMLGAGTALKELNPNFNETFTDVTDPKKVTAQVLVKLLNQLGLSDQTGLLKDISALQKVGADAKALMNEAGQGIKKLFGK